MYQFMLGYISSGFCIFGLYVASYNIWLGLPFIFIAAWVAIWSCIKEDQL